MMRLIQLRRKYLKFYCMWALMETEGTSNSRILRKLVCHRKEEERIGQIKREKKGKAGPFTVAGNVGEKS